MSAASNVAQYPLHSYAHIPIAPVVFRLWGWFIGTAYPGADELIGRLGGGKQPLVSVIPVVDRLDLQFVIVEQLTGQD